MQLVEGLLLFSFILYSQGLKPNMTNIGDVRLYSGANSIIRDGIYEGEAQMYLTDGSSPEQWSRICKSGTFDIAEAKIFCKQLNCSYDEILPYKVGLPSAPYLISNIQCKERKKYNSLLDCSYTLGLSQSCEEGVLLRCKNSSSPISEGQLEICPPDQSKSFNAISSVSFGIIGVNINDHWRAIESSTISQGAGNIAHLMCKSLGFQQAVSGSPRKAKSIEQYTFSTCQQRYRNYSWINMDDLVKNCDVEKPYPCLGCCLKYPIDPSCAGTQPCANNFIVIQCTFNLFEKNEQQTEQDNCFFSENPQKGDRILNFASICNRKNVNIGEAFLGALFAFFFGTTAVLVLVNYAFYRCKNAKKKGDCTPLLGDNKESPTSPNPKE